LGAAARGGGHAPNAAYPRGKQKRLHGVKRKDRVRGTPAHGVDKKETGLT
jgi:hypothetical protein